MPKKQEGNTTEGATTVSQPEMVTITLNNREVEVPKDAAEVLKQQEHDLKSGYDAILQNERAAIQAEQEKHDALFAEDLEFYNTYPQTEWEFYSPKVDGGNGYMPSEVPATQTDTTQSTPVFNNDPKVSSLENKIKELEKKLEGVSEGVVRSGAEQVKIVRDELITKYPGAGLVIADINNQLGEYYDTHGNTHAPPVEIERIVKAQHSRVEKYAAGRMKGNTVLTDKTTLPPVGGAAPSASKPPPLNISNSNDMDEIIKRGEEYLKESGLFSNG